MEITFSWRGPFTTIEANALHAQAFETRVFDESDWDWEQLTQEHSLGWVTARDADGGLVGFVNIISDGLVHAWIQDVMVDHRVRHQGVGKELVAGAVQGAKDATCEWLHVDFDDDLRPFYFDACGFTPTNAGLIQL